MKESKHAKSKKPSKEIHHKKKHDSGENAKVQPESHHHHHHKHTDKQPHHKHANSVERDRPKKHKRKHNSPSTEELSRKKKRIESELHALDLEEAAQRRHRRNPDRDRARNSTMVHVKEEPASDEPDEREHSRPEAHHHHHRHKHSSQVEDDDKQWGHSRPDPKKSDNTNNKPKQKPNMACSGKLAEDTNTYNGVVIKYNEPAEARKPKKRWRLYPFKGDSPLPFIPVHRQSAYLFGRTRTIADIPIDHPSCSKQHAVLQFRLVPFQREDGSTGRRVRPYIIDLESSNGTFVNNKQVDPRCYVELMEKDVVKFGYSTREYVMLHEESKNDFDDEDIIEERGATP